MLGWLAFGLLWWVQAWAQGTGTSPAELYLLSGTTTEHSPQSYPVFLYRAKENKRLEGVREVVPQSEGARLVCAWGDAIFVLHPHWAPTSSSIVHTDDPKRVDDIAFRPDGVLPISSATTAASPPGSALVLLIPWITNLTDPGHPPAQLQATDARIVSSAAGGSQRVQLDTWSDYGYLRYGGAPGGPNYVTDHVGSAEGNDLIVEVFGHSAIIDRLSPKLKEGNRKIEYVIVAASKEYLILMRQHRWEDVQGGKLGDSLELYVHDRIADRWSTIQSDGNSPTLRLFGLWLATIVGNWSINHGPNPGRNNERSQAEATDRLPPVQALYASFKGRNISLLGILTLQNLRDGRRIRIETGQEDSEVLQVNGDVVLYRVNDTIYRAKIVGNKLTDTSVVVKDEDVPEIHWAFWSELP